MTELSIGEARLVLDEKGFVNRIAAGDESLLPAGLEEQPFMQIGAGGRLLTPNKLDTRDHLLVFAFEKEIKITLSYHAVGAYASFKVVEASKEAEAIVFGPIFTNLAAVIGDIVGVVQGEKWAFRRWAPKPWVGSRGNIITV